MWLAINHNATLWIRSTTRHSYNLREMILMLVVFKEEKEYVLIPKSDQNGKCAFAKKSMNS